MLSGKTTKKFSHKFYMLTVFIAFSYLIADSVKSGYRTVVISNGEHPEDPMTDINEIESYLYAQTLSDILYRITIICLLISIYLSMVGM